MTLERPRLFPKSLRLTQKKDFEHLRERSFKSFVSPLVVYSKDSRLGHSHARVGFSVSKRQGNAVRRNRLKRILRDEFRHSDHIHAKGLDLLVIAAQTVKDEQGMRSAFRKILKDVLTK
jgi:ribonuclease P protein component